MKSCKVTLEGNTGDMSIGQLYPFHFWASACPRLQRKAEGDQCQRCVIH